MWRLLASLVAFVHKYGTAIRMLQCVKDKTPETTALITTYRAWRQSLYHTGQITLQQHLKLMPARSYVLSSYSCGSHSSECTQDIL